MTKQWEVMGLMTCRDDDEDDDNDRMIRTMMKRCGRKEIMMM